MNKVSWEFFLSRNNLSINDFISGKETLSDAMLHFEAKGLTQPSIDIVEVALSENAQDEIAKAKIVEDQEKKKLLPKPTASRRSKAKTAPKSPAPAKKTRASSKSEVKDEEETKRYFRKVVPTKKTKK